jgi:iron complex outermembrane receptor protein
MKNRFCRAMVPALSLLASAISTLSVASASSLPEVVVVGSRFEESASNVPTTVQVITAQAIRDSAAMSVPEALSMLAGANIRSVSGGQLGVGSSVDLGGFGVTATQNNLVLVDGRRLNPIDSSEIDWAAIPLNAIQRIEIATGGAGVEYGAGATGGVINIITNGKMADSTEAQLGAGSFGTALASISLNRKLDDAYVNLNMAANHSDGWRQNSQNDSQSVSGKFSKNISADASGFVEVFASHQANGFAGGVLGKAGEGDQQVTKFNNVGSGNDASKSGLRLGGTAELAPGTSLEGDVVYSTKSSTYRQPYYDTSDSLAGGFVEGPGTSLLSGSDLSFSPRLRTVFGNGATLVVGYDFSQANQDGANQYGPLAQQFILGDQGGFGYVGNIVRDVQQVQLLNQSAYVVSRIPLVSAWELSVGARRQLQRYDTYDQNKSSGTQSASGQFGANALESALNYKFDALSHAYIRADQSYRFANTDEYWGYDPVTYNRVFSGELQPQTTKAFAVGYERSNAVQQVSVTLGQSVTQNEIRYSPAMGRNSNLADNVFRNSLNVGWSVQALEHSRVSLGVHLQRAEYATGANAGQTLSMVPNAVYNLGWVQALDGQNKLGLQVVYVSTQNYDAPPATVATLDQLPAYTVADLFWTHTSGKLETKVTVKNLAGSSYATYGGYGFVTMPGGTGANSYYYYPSDPRSVFVNMTYRF